MPGAGPDTDPGPDVATQIATRRFLQFGMFRTRVSFASCAPTEEVASAVFAFFNDGSDANANGIVDNPEIDFQVLCGTPTFIVLTCWSDFERATATTPERFIKRSHAVDLSTGDIYDTVSDSDNAFAKTTTGSDLVTPGFPDPNGFYEVGFDWQPSSVRFFIVNQGREITLWTLGDSKVIPQVPLQFMLNLWHPTEHWIPARSPANYPATRRGAARGLGRVLGTGAVTIVAAVAEGFDAGIEDLTRRIGGEDRRPEGIVRLATTESMATFLMAGLVPLR